MSPTVTITPSRFGVRGSVREQGARSAAGYAALAVLRSSLRLCPGTGEPPGVDLLPEAHP